jgi:hypothetical protein
MANGEHESQKRHQQVELHLDLEGPCHAQGRTGTAVNQVVQIEEASLQMPFSGRALVRYINVLRNIRKKIVTKYGGSSRVNRRR